MKRCSWMLLAVVGAVVAAVGCRAPSIEARRNERLSVYQAFPAATRQLIDRGEIAEGMDTNAIYIAWGRPAELFFKESEAGQEMLWLYYGTWTEKVPRWVYFPSREGWGTVDYHVIPRSRRYLRASVRFREGRVVEWRVFERPAAL